MAYGAANKGADFNTYMGAVMQANDAINTKKALNRLEGSKINISTDLAKSKMLSEAEQYNTAEYNQALKDLAQRQDFYGKDKASLLTAIGDNIAGYGETLSNKKMAEDMKPYMEYLALLKNLGVGNNK